LVSEIAVIFAASRLLAWKTPLATVIPTGAPEEFVPVERSSSAKRRDPWNVCYTLRPQGVLTGNWWMIFSAGRHIALR